MTDRVTVAILAVVAATSSVAGYWHSRTTTGVPESHLRSFAGNDKTPKDAGEEQGSEDDLEISLVPSEVSSSAKKLKYRLKMANKSAHKAKTKYAIEIVNDLGDLLAPPLVSDVASIEGAEIIEEPFSSMALPVGFLMIRATVAASGKGIDSTETTHLYLSVTDSDILILEPHEWMEQSAINEGYDL